MITTLLIVLAVIAVLLYVIAAGVIIDQYRVHGIDGLDWTALVVFLLAPVLVPYRLIIMISESLDEPFFSY